MNPVICHSDSIINSKVNLFLESNLSSTNKIDSIVNILAGHTIELQAIVNGCSTSSAEYWSWIFTIAGTIITITLTIITIILMIQNKEQRISIEELKKQTESLKDLVLLEYEPNLAVESDENPRGNGNDLHIRNFGGDCKNLIIAGEISFIKDKLGFADGMDIPKNNTRRLIYTKPNTGDHFIEFYYEDKINNKFKQILVITGNQNHAVFKNPEKIIDKINQ